MSPLPSTKPKKSPSTLLMGLFSGLMKDRSGNTVLKFFISTPGSIITYRGAIYAFICSCPKFANEIKRMKIEMENILKKRDGRICSNHPRLLRAEKLDKHRDSAC